MSIDIILLTPISSTNILSKPTGPNELLTIFAIAFAAITFCVRIGVPDVLEPATVKALAEPDMI